MRCCAGASRVTMVSPFVPRLTRDWLAVDFFVSFSPPDFEHAASRAASNTGISEVMRFVFRGFSCARPPTPRSDEQRRQRTILPLPRGEGRGEGKAVVRPGTRV